jgi:hypothetical protein
MHHSLHPNSQTSIRIHRTDEQTYFAVIRSIYDWLIKKKREKVILNKWKEFSFKGQWEQQGNSQIHTVTCIQSEDVRSWALEYVHPDSSLGPKRYWHTHVGLRDTGEDLIISVRVGYSWNHEDLSIEAEPPSPSVPNFVKILVAKFKAYSGRKEFRLIETPLPLGEKGHGQLINDFVFSPERRYPLIVFNGDSEEHKLEANRLASQLTGKAQVVIVANNPTIGDELKQAFPYDYHIAYKTMRVFFPMHTGQRSSVRHRWYDIATTDYEDQRAGIVSGLLRNHNLFEKDAIESIADVYRLISKTKLSKLSQSTTEASPEETQKFYLEYITETENKLKEAKLEAEEYAQIVDEHAATIQNLEWTCQSLAKKTEKTHLLSIDRNILSVLPSSLPEVVNLASKLYADRMIFADEAFESAEESSSCELVADAWAILFHLSTTLYDLVFKTQNPGDIGRTFQDRTGFEYARTEGKQTKNSRELCNLRKIQHNGKDYEIWPHIKKGNEGNKMIRIHFDFDTDTEKILIGFVGLHMGNASTRTKK